MKKENILEKISQNNSHKTSRLNAIFAPVILGAMVSSITGCEMDGGYSSSSCRRVIVNPQVYNPPVIYNPPAYYRPYVYRPYVYRPPVIIHPSPRPFNNSPYRGPYRSPNRSPSRDHNRR